MSWIFHDRLTYQIERAKLVGESVILIGDFDAKLGKDLIKNDIHDMSKNGKLPYQLYTNAELGLLNSGISAKACSQESTIKIVLKNLSLIKPFVHQVH